MQNIGKTERQNKNHMETIWKKWRYKEIANKLFLTIEQSSDFIRQKTY